MSDKTPLTTPIKEADVDWCQVKETVLMLKLSAAQVEFSMTDGSSSVDTLTSSFTGIADSINEIEVSTKEVFEKYNVSKEDQQTVESNCVLVSDNMQKAIVAFQFYDTLVQRMEHVVNSLSNLGDLVSDPERIYSPDQWKALQDDIRGRYTMEKERELFDAILNGDDMVEIMRKMHEVAASDGNVVLF